MHCRLVTTIKSFLSCELTINLAPLICFCIFVWSKMLFKKLRHFYQMTIKQLIFWFSFCTLKNNRLWKHSGHKGPKHTYLLTGTVRIIRLRKKLRISWAHKKCLRAISLRFAVSQNRIKVRRFFSPGRSSVFLREAKRSKEKFKDILRNISKLRFLWDFSWSLGVWYSVFAGAYFYSGSDF